MCFPTKCFILINRRENVLKTNSFKDTSTLVRGRGKEIFTFIWEMELFSEQHLIELFVPFRYSKSQRNPTRWIFQTRNAIYSLFLCRIRTNASFAARTTMASFPMREGRNDMHTESSLSRGAAVCEKWGRCAASRDMKYSASAAT